MSEITFEHQCLLFSYTPKGRTLTTKEVVEILMVHLQTIEGWRVTGEGARYFQPKCTRRYWYKEHDVLAWMSSGAKRSISENRAA